MLLELHVKNLALIEKADVEFGAGLNILTGETGAGKSIILGSVNLALGGKGGKDMIRTGSGYAYVELVFSVPSPAKLAALKALDVIPDDDGILIISRKIMPSRSVSKVNDETVTAAKLRQITGLLLDIHGQHEHQSLLYHSKHLEILDFYGKFQTQQLKTELAEAYQQYRQLQDQLSEAELDQESRVREIDFLRFEIAEIGEAGIRPGEEEELQLRYRKINNRRRIAESLSQAHDAVNDDSISHALKAVSEAAGYDEALTGIRDQLYDVDALLSDINHEISAYMDDMTFDESVFQETEQRLDLIRSLQAKYGGTEAEILKNLQKKQERLEFLENLDILRIETEKNLKKQEQKLEKVCGHLSEIRRNTAKTLTKKIKQGLLDLNFLEVEFEMDFRRQDSYSANGFDQAEFLISANPGEPLRPLGHVASGGELSRIMLAIKTVLADSDDIGTLIFDEIDTGISGRTAQKVSEKLAIIAKSHQVICITHLPQIAAMADCHYEIAKAADSGKTTTVIRALSREEMVAELARLLGGAEITDTVLQNAKEMKELAVRTK